MAENSEQVLWARHEKLYKYDGFWWGGWLGKGGRRTMFIFVVLRDDYTGLRRTREARAGCVSTQYHHHAEAFLRKVVVIGDGNHTYCKAGRSSEEIRVDKSD